MNDRIVLLDGAMGTELRARGIEVPDHVTSIWSAQALIDAPASVLEIHRDYIEAGADVVTLNNYAVTPRLLAREGLEERFRELTLRAADLARQARDEESRDVRIAGSLPPLDTSYRPELVGDDRAILEDYRRMAELLAPRVDILLCETMSSAREAFAAATAAAETDAEVWVSCTLKGNRLDRLPSGETIRAAVDALSVLPIDALLVNCCGANFVTQAVQTLSSLTTRPVGGYANATEVGLDRRRLLLDPSRAHRTASSTDRRTARVLASGIRVGVRVLRFASDPAERDGGRGGEGGDRPESQDEPGDRTQPAPPKVEPDRIDADPGEHDQRGDREVVSRAQCEEQERGAEAGERQDRHGQHGPQRRVGEEGPDPVLETPRFVRRGRLFPPAHLGTGAFALRHGSSIRRCDGS
jgi:S-methylmethionine-dependent homocysteine/selenocysteine methylase